MLELQALSFLEAISERGLVAITDLLLTVLFFYAVLSLVHKKRAYFSLLGFGMIFVLYLLSNSIGFLTASWILDNFLKFSVVILVLLFQEDLKRGLANLYILTWRPFWKKGKNVFWQSFEGTLKDLLKTGKGAFFCFDKYGLLNEFLDRGVRLGVPYSKEIVKAILASESPVKDGAIILSPDGTIKACAVIFPFSSEPEQRFSGSAKLQAASYVSYAFECFAVVISSSRKKLYLFKDGVEFVFPEVDEAMKEIMKGLQQ